MQLLKFLYKERWFDIQKWCSEFLIWILCQQISEANTTFVMLKSINNSEIDLNKVKRIDGVFRKGKQKKSSYHWVDNICKYTMQIVWFTYSLISMQKLTKRKFLYECNIFFVLWNSQRIICTDDLRIH